MFIFILYNNDFFFSPKSYKYFKNLCRQMTLVWVWVLTCRNGRALRHLRRDFLVPYLTANGFGPLINSDEWRPVHNPLCTWPHVLSVSQDLKTAPTARRGQLLPPVGQGCSLAALGNVHFWLRISTKAEFSSRPWRFQARDSCTRQWHTQVVN